MRPESVHLLLRKQRLQWQADQQRQACIGMLHEIESSLVVLQRLRTGAHEVEDMLRRHAVGLSLAGLALIVWRPRGIQRWLRRGWLVYWGVKRLRSSFGTMLANLRGAFSV